MARRSAGTLPQADRSDDLALIGRIAAGEHAAFESLYRTFKPRLLGFLRRILPDGQTAEETADDVMMIVWRDASRFEGRSRLTTWIFGIAYRQAANALRRRCSLEIAHAEPPGAVRDTADGVETSDWLSSALAQLSVDHRTVVELTFVYGFSYQEIADIMGCPVNTVKTRMFHARRHLQHALAVLEQPCGSSDS